MLKVNFLKDSAFRLGVDVGSTTVKLAFLDAKNQLFFQEYRWHFSDVRITLVSLLKEVLAKTGNLAVLPVMTGSGGLTLAHLLDIPFEQEVIAGTRAIEVFIPETDVAIELGGEDAKLTYFDSHGVDQRMNNSCAGGTGAFIDQMATLLGTDAAGLNRLAEKYKTFYPIASRCGVFAKTDVQPLINEGAAKEDIAASILQAIVNQTIGGLACGNPIRGRVAFLGGPLTFLPMLRTLFKKTLNLAPNEIIFPENSNLFVAIGAALLVKESQKPISLEELIVRLENIPAHTIDDDDLMPPLFENEQELQKFRSRHALAKSEYVKLESYTGKVFIGIDSGSTTTKAVVIGEQGELLYSFYSNNLGNPVDVVKKLIKEIYSKLNPRAKIAGSTSTGYGEHLIKAAFKVDYGIVETIAHYKAAEKVLPGVEFILDIGGQDMKCLTIKNGAIHSISLNEACSAGCGSFIETFAMSLKINIAEFAKMALLAKMPIDLGTRCTVFMNSNVKQAQKEGATVADISAGLSYAVIRNALFKVIRLRRIDDLPEKIIVQGGTFYNEAVLRAFELLTGRDVVRMDIAGLMGAYGAALVALEHQKGLAASSFIKMHELDAFAITKHVDYCSMCSNKCRIMVNTFTDGREFITGNRCEKGSKIQRVRLNLPNLYQYKLKRFFNYKPLAAVKSTRGSVGIPRVLNQYENYPFWHVFFTQLGFRVVLSPTSSSRLHHHGIETIPSESVCYPAKLAHGHIEYLLNKKVDRIFFPSVVYESKEFEFSDDHFNCPVVSAYSEVVYNNINALRHQNVDFHNPFLNIHDKRSLLKVLHEEFMHLGVSREEVKSAISSAWAELKSAREDMRQKGLEVLTYLAETDLKGIVLAGRPYHIDPGINHGIDKIIIEEGMAVLTEDSVAHLGAARIKSLRVVDQWTYHSRLYAAASLVAAYDNVELVQLTSFGCGLDALTGDQVEEILESENKIFTLIKIDEGENLGAARIRIRSLKAAMDEKAELTHGIDKSSKSLVSAIRFNLQTQHLSKNKIFENIDSHAYEQKSNEWAGNISKDKKKGIFGLLSDAKAYAEFIKTKIKNLVRPHITPTPAVYTEEMHNKGYTILAPQMAPMHFDLVCTALAAEGHKVVLLDKVGRAEMEHGLKYVHNDACYPCIMVVGQLIEALNSGKFDKNRVALIISQTGGQCRATNYLALLRKALADINCEHVPVISLNAKGLADNPGFKYSFTLLKRAVMAILLGDVLMRCLLRTRPYEKEHGLANGLYYSWNNRCKEFLRGKIKKSAFDKLLKVIITDFDNLPLTNEQKPKVGVVGEILVKFHPDANNDIIGNIEAEGGEAVLPDLLDFFLYCFHGVEFDYKNYGKSYKDLLGNRFAVWFLERMRKNMRKYLKASKRFAYPIHIKDMAKLASKMVSLGNQSGEGWLLTGEMMELIETGTENIVCVQPFACLPNHITGRGMIKALKERYPSSNIVAIDYDPGVSEVNQLNRLKLMMSVAKNNLAKNKSPQ